jgi:hypothetical protein
MKLKVLKPFRGILSNEKHWLPDEEVEVSDENAAVLLATWPDRFEKLDEPKKRGRPPKEHVNG